MAGQKIIFDSDNEDDGAFLGEPVEENEAASVHTASDVSDDDDEAAPEAVSMEAGKQLAAQDAKSAKSAIQKMNKEQKQKRRERDAKLKEQAAARTRTRTSRQKPAEPAVSENVDNVDNEVPVASDKPAPLPIDILEQIADQHLAIDDDVTNDQEVQQSIKRRKIKKEFVKQGIRVVALQSMPSKPTVSESILEFKQRHFFGQRVKRISAMQSAATSERRRIPLKFAAKPKA